MRVLHLGKFWPPYAGGIERAMHDLCVALVARGTEVAVLAHAPPGRWRASHGNEQGVQVHLAGCIGQLAYAPVGPALAPALNRLIRDFRPVLLHLHVPNPAAFWPLALPAARHLPWVLHWHADIPLAGAPASVRMLYPVYRRAETALLRRARRVIATSPDYRDSSHALEAWRDKTRVIPLGVPEPAAVDATATTAARALWRGEGLRVLAVGRLSHYKGFDVLLEAIAKTSGTQLLLIGDGECANELRAQAKSLGVADRVHMAGAVDDRLRDAAYAEAELMCLPSTARSEAFGVVLLEAMRAGVPALASDVPGSGMSHVLDKGRAGCLVPPNDARALAAAIAELAADPSRRHALAQAGRARWQQHFKLEAEAASMQALYREVLGQP